MIVAPVAPAAARYAVEHWHYSERMPAPPLVHFGVWEDDRFVGVVLFGRGANQHTGVHFGVSRFEVSELVRVALRDHIAPVSQIATRAVTLLRASSPALRLLVSYADPAHGHHGGIYQAMNWLYLGATASTNPVWRHKVTGELLHNRVVTVTGTVRQFGRLTRVARVDECDKLIPPPKHTYALPLDRAMRRQLARYVQPYPRGGGVHGDTPAVPAGRAGSTPAHRSTQAP